jgi:hypothetical protein
MELGLEVSLCPTGTWSYPTAGSYYLADPKRLFDDGVIKEAFEVTGKGFTIFELHCQMTSTRHESFAFINHK